jgi:hypothetical protein
VVKDIAMDALQWEHCITHRIEAGEALAMYERINEGDREDLVGVVIHWAD